MIENIDLSDNGPVVQATKKYKILYETAAEFFIEFPATLDAVTSAIHYAKTAQLYNNPSVIREKLARRYGRNTQLLLRDLSAGPGIICALEIWATKLPENSKTKQFAKQQLPSVKTFYDNLQNYAQERFQPDLPTAP